VFAVPLTPVAAQVAPIAYSDATGDLFTAQSDGSGSARVAAGGPSASFEALDITSDGTSILAIQFGDDRRVVLVSVATGAVRAIAGTTGADAASMSNDGKTVVFSTSQGVYTVDISSGRLAEIVDTPAGATDTLARVSPDARTVAFARTTPLASGDDETALHVVPAAGGITRQVAANVLTARSVGGGIAFSPDGRRLLYAGDDASPGIRSVSTSGGAPTVLTTELDYWPVFLDASTVLFARSSTSPNADTNAASPRYPEPDDLYELWSVPAGGGAATVLAEGDYETLAVELAAPATTAGRGQAAPPGSVQAIPTLHAQAVVAAGGFPIGVGCRTACTVRSVLVGVLRRAHRSLTARVPQWGSASARLPHGGRAKLFVRLNAKARKAFAKGGSFRLTLRTTVRSPAGRRTLSQPIRFRP
jgi:hypothetical protein